ncbi:hypothetical protein Dcar01_01045 [Deinococcus carri]|uniref:Uncharacterized protein n=1 Tax=Deinococcus carri TaxID=1211323 RepID=A0ABP9W5Q9_9DEIO
MTTVRPPVKRILARTSSVAFGLNFAWEMLQMPLFQGMNWSPGSWALCAAASLGDAAFSAAAYGALAWAHRDAWWVCRRDGLDVVLIFVGGLLAAVVGEWVSHALGWWSYSPLMPRVPGLGVGVVPFVQLALLTVVTFELLRASGGCRPHTKPEPMDGE